MPSLLDCYLDSSIAWRVCMAFTFLCLLASLALSAVNIWNEWQAGRYWRAVRDGRRARCCFRR